MDIEWLGEASETGRAFLTGGSWMLASYFLSSQVLFALLLFLPCYVKCPSAEGERNYSVSTLNSLSLTIHVKKEK